MSLIKSISGIRGTIGGKSGEGLNPLDIVKFTAAYSSVISKKRPGGSRKIVVGRDARLSGQMLYQCVSGTLIGMGFDVVDIGLASTPTTEIAVVAENADGGIILTASHNPYHWNALKLLNEKGEFFDKETGEEVLRLAQAENFKFKEVTEIGHITSKDYTNYHIQKILQLNLVDVEAIRKARFSVIIDCVNSVGGIIIPALLEALGVKRIFQLNCIPNGRFAHNPEPIPENLTQISEATTKCKVDVGFVVDPDVDRLAIICENGEMFGEEYTLVSCADYVLQFTPGNTSSNLSSTRALRDITHIRGGEYQAAAVGEVNVVNKMKDINAVIGGEGNGGIIYPAAHYGRDALVGIALFLSNLARIRSQISNYTVSNLKTTYPQYCIVKFRIDLTPETDIDVILSSIKEKYINHPNIEVNDIDGVKIDFSDCWVHLRKSNTEPIIRIYAEAATEQKAKDIANEIIKLIKK